MCVFDMWLWLFVFGMGLAVYVHPVLHNISHPASSACTLLQASLAFHTASAARERASFPISTPFYSLLARPRHESQIPFIRNLPPVNTAAPRSGSPVAHCRLRSALELRPVGSNALDSRSVWREWLDMSECDCRCSGRMAKEIVDRSVGFAGALQLE